jgi:hypothetical protein
VPVRRRPPVEARRITGAGDTFMAAHIAAELAGSDREAALGFAVGRRRATFRGMTMDDLISPPRGCRGAGERAAIVALESTIITHGMPYPQNLETARAVEAAVRAAGAVPATIAVMGGRLMSG